MKNRNRSKEESIDAAALARIGIDPALAGIQIASDQAPEPDVETVCKKLNVTPEEFARYRLEVGRDNCADPLEHENCAGVMEAALDYRAARIPSLDCSQGERLQRLCASLGCSEREFITDAVLHLLKDCENDEGVLDVTRGTIEERRSTDV